ncbi:hypothetical protein [Aquibium microcysteis]|uniref:hypothetical protein n=1 Tax=Aquibium microcysteis TaxID=675281 RepID=UPI00165D135D|nr:hypothetical protein [Aquibium microcysteis]
MTERSASDAPAPARRSIGPGRRTRIRPALRLLAGSIAWSLAIVASCAASLLARAWQNADAQAAVILLFWFGALLAYAPAVLLADRFGGHRAETRFAAAMVLLAGATIGITAFLFGLWYRLYYAHWHEPALTIGWIFQFIFTVAAACYHFLVLGLRMYLPVGLPALLAFSLVLARTRR